MTDLNKRRHLLASCLAGILFTSASYAGLPESRILPQSGTRATPGIVYVEIKGVVLAPPPCKVNNDNLIVVNFGEVMSTRIDGSAYEQKVNYGISCEKMPTQAMTMSVQGNGALFDTKSLETNIEGLGIALRYNNQKLNLNEKVKFTYPNAPQFYVVPVRDLTKTLQGGPFEAVATIMLDYQ
ncbi:fimbrial protein [Providencia sp. Je.9.19]|uniref:fimbrial protein n=1 Tax=unclassified Providencia TaxID=2633465 RepID=UPI003DA9337E